MRIINQILLTKKIIAIIVAMLCVFAITSVSFPAEEKKAASPEKKIEPTQPAEKKASEKLKRLAGEVKAVDAVAKTITLARDIKDKVEEIIVTVNNKTKITLNNEEKTFADVKLGDKVEVYYTTADGKNTARAIDVRTKKLIYVAQPKIPKEKIPSEIPSEMKEHIEKLYSSDPKERANGAIELGEIGKRAFPVVPFLIGILHDTKPVTLSSLVLTPNGFSKYVVVESSDVGYEAAKALSKIGAPAVEYLIETLKDEDWDVQVRAVWALGEIKDSRAVNPLIAILEDKYLETRIPLNAVMFALGSGRELIPGNKGIATYIRKLVVEALGKIGDRRTIEPLIATLKDNKWSI
ncbi:MAG: HEAT repeat domain-containing protein [Nitrospirae bacterium]|nr:HEAT repeat domain-containing protein [Nitrospirota bacterium]